MRTRHHLRQRAVECGGDRGVIVGHIVRFARVGQNVVELRPRRANQFVALVAKRDELAPVEMKTGKIGLRVQLLSRHSVPAHDDRRQIAAVERAWRGNALEPEDGRGHVDEARWAIDDRAGVLAAGQPHDPRHMEGRIVHEQPMLVLAVISEPLTVVRQKNDDGAVEDVMVLQVRDRLADDRIGICDLAVIRAVSVASAVRLGRRVGCVRIEQVEPDEESFLHVVVQPPPDSPVMATCRIE